MFTLFVCLSLCAEPDAVPENVAKWQAVLREAHDRHVAAAEKKLDEAYATWAQDVRAKAYVEFREPPQ